MASTGPILVAPEAKIITPTPAVTMGFSTYLGAGGAIIGAVVMIISAIKANDTATITAGVAALLTAIATIGSRGRQAVELIRANAKTVERVMPLVSAGVSGTTGNVSTSADFTSTAPTATGFQPMVEDMGHDVYDPQSDDAAEDPNLDTLVPDEAEGIDPTVVQPSQDEEAGL